MMIVWEGYMNDLENKGLHRRFHRPLYRILHSHLDMLSDGQDGWDARLGILYLIFCQVQYILCKTGTGTCILIRHH